MIDHLIKTSSEAAAIADPVLGKYYIASSDGAGWRGDCVIPNVLVWQPSADTTSTDADGNTIVTHHPITDANGNPYWYVMISLAAQDANLTAHPGMVLVTDRGKALAGQPFVLASPLGQTDLATYMLQPCFAGSGYPFGHPA